MSAKPGIDRLFGVALFLWAGMWGWSAAARAQPWPQPELAEARAAAAKAQQALAKLRNLDHTGFDTGGELQAAVLGESMADATIEADRLIGLNPPRNFRQGVALLFPLSLGGTIRAFIEVEHGPHGGWQPIRFVEARPGTRLAFELREAQRTAFPTAKLEFYLVRSPPLNLEVFGMRFNGKPVIAPLSSKDPHFGGSMEFMHFKDAVLILRKYYLSQVLQRDDLRWLQRRRLQSRLHDTPSAAATIPRGPSGTPLKAAIAPP